MNSRCDAFYTFTDRLYIVARDYSFHFLGRFPRAIYDREARSTFVSEQISNLLNIVNEQVRFEDRRGKFIININ